MEKQNYYNVGSRDSIVISSSSLKSIDPSSGGSPQQFLAFFDDKTEEKENKALKMGKLIHLWAENKDNFFVSETPKPSEIMGLIADRCLEEVKFNNADFTRQLACNISLAMNYQPKWLLPTRMTNVYDGISAYVWEVIQSQDDNQIYLTVKEAEVIEKCVESINKHPLAKELLFMQDNDFSNKQTFKEQEVFWEQLGLLFKAKIDDFTIDHERKVVIVNDLKSMGSSVYEYKNFKYYKTYRQFAFYFRAIQQWAIQNKVDITNYKFFYNIIGIETGLLNQCVVWKVKQEWITRGSLEIIDLFKRIKWHIQNDQWNYSKEEFENGYYLEMPYEED